MRIGAHMSVAGGVARAVERAVLHGCEALQISRRTTARWQGKPLDADEVRALPRRRRDDGITPVVVARQLSHQSCDDRPAAARPVDRRAGRRAGSRARARPARRRRPPRHVRGRHRGATALRPGRRRRSRARSARAARRTMVLLEHTAGQGRTLGHRFEHLAAIIEQLDGSPASASAWTPAICSRRDTTS